MHGYTSFYIYITKADMIRTNYTADSSERELGAATFVPLLNRCENSPDEMKTGM